MAKKDKTTKPTNRANLSQNLDKQPNVSAGMDKRGGQSPK